VYGRHVSILTLACIAVSFVIIDGPLLQRASTVVAAETTKTVMLDLRLPAELPSAFSGAYLNHEFGYTPLSYKTCTDFTQGVPVPLNATECKGTVSESWYCRSWTYANSCCTVPCDCPGTRCCKTELLVAGLAYHTSYGSRPQRMCWRPINDV